MEPAAEFSFTKKAIIKNLLVISIAFFLVYTATNALTNIQSSLHSEQGLGVFTLCAVFVGLVVSCMFVPPLLLQYIDCKWGMSLAITSCIFYTAANFYATWYTMIPTAILTGFGEAILWAAQGAYFTEMSYEYSQIVGKSKDSVLTQFFGIFYAFYLFSQITGNLASSLALTPPGSLNGTNNPWNLPDQLKICGSNFCNQPQGIEAGYINGTNKNVISFEPNINQVYILVGVCVICDLLAFFLISVLLNPLRKTYVNKVFGWKLLIATLRNLKNVKQLLLIPLNILLGLQISFLSSDFTQGFVTCSLGIYYVGYVMVCGGVVSAIAALILGTVTKDLPRPPINVFAAIVHIAACVTMLKWHPNPSMPAVYFVIAGLWSLANAIWLTQVSALYGILFPHNSEAAFSNNQLWLGVGGTVGFAWSKYLCMSTKLYAIIIFTICSIACYLFVEFLLSREKQRSKSVLAIENFISLRNKN